MLTVSLLVCAMMALARVNGDEDTAINATAIPEVRVKFFAHTTCPSGWTLYSQRCFQFVPLQQTWADAQKHCLTIKGSLASIHNQEEYQFVQGLTTSLLPTWIGGSDCQQESAWFWIGGPKMEFVGWCSGQPDNTKDQCCLQINTGGAKCWDDQPCNTPLPSVCVLT